MLYASIGQRVDDEATSTLQSATLSKLLAVQLMITGLSDVLGSISFRRISESIS